MLLFSILSGDCSLRELYHYQLDSLKYYILSNIFSIQTNDTAEEDKVRLWRLYNRPNKGDPMFV